MIRGVVIGAAIATGCTNSGPELDSVAPAAAQHDAIVTINGQRLCGPSHDCTHAGGELAIGLTPPTVLAPIMTYGDTTATISIPSLVPVGKTTLVLTVNDIASNALDFEVLP